MSSEVLEEKRQRTRGRTAVRNRERFVRLAEKRVTRAIRDIRLVGNLSNTNNYSYSPADAQKIIRVLEAEIKNLRHKFENGAAQGDAIFKL